MFFYTKATKNIATRAHSFYLCIKTLTANTMRTGILFLGMAILLALNPMTRAQELTQIVRGRVIDIEF